MATALAATILLDDDADIEAHQRADIGAEAAVMGSDQNAIPDPGQAHGDLLDARVERARGTVDTLQQFDLLGTAHDVQRVALGIQLGHLRADESLHTALLASTRDRTRGLCGLGQRIEADGVAVGKTGLLAGLGAHTNALIEVETAFLDDAVLQYPGFRNLALKVQIGGIDA